MASSHQPRAYYGRHADALVIVLTGHLAYTSVRAMRPFLDDLLATLADETIIIDLRQLDAIDSTGMGLLARLGRTTLARGRRTVIVCSVPDVLTCLRSAAFDTLFILEDQWPFDCGPELSEVKLDDTELHSDVMARFMLDAHCELASMNEENAREFGGVIEALMADLSMKG